MASVNNSATRPTTPDSPRPPNPNTPRTNAINEFYRKKVEEAWKDRSSNLGHCECHKSGFERDCKKWSTYKWLKGGSFCNDENGYPVLRVDEGKDRYVFFFQQHIIYRILEREDASGKLHLQSHIFKYQLSENSLDNSKETQPRTSNLDPEKMFPDDLYAQNRMKECFQALSKCTIDINSAPPYMRTSYEFTQNCPKSYAEEFDTWQHCIISRILYEPNKKKSEQKDSK